MRYLILLLIFSGLNTIVYCQQANELIPHVLVYKTKGDYRNLVPIVLSEDKTRIMSYPDMADVKTGSGYPLPVLLHKGYLLDRRGIGKQTAFIRLTYPQYHSLKKLPERDELMEMIVDKNPLTELFDCGSKNFKGLPTLINGWIDNNQLEKNCKKINWPH